MMEAFQLRNVKWPKNLGFTFLDKSYLIIYFINKNQKI